MANVATLLTNATNGSRVSRNGDIVVVVMDTYAFVTTSQEWQMATQWARSKQSQGNVHKDRTALVGRLEVIVGRSGGGCATKGPNKVLQRVVQAMEQAGMDPKDFILPPTLWEEIEIKKKAKPEGEGAEGDAGAEPPKA